MHFDYPFGLYSEYPSLLVQDVLLLLLIVHYERQQSSNTAIKAFLPASLMIHLLIGYKWVPRYVPLLMLVGFLIDYVNCSC